MSLLSCVHLVCSLVITGDLPERNENVNILVACEWHLNDVSKQNIPVRVESLGEHLHEVIPFRSGAVILAPASYKEIGLEDALSFIVRLLFLTVNDLPKFKRNTFFDSYLEKLVSQLAFLMDI